MPAFGLDPPMTSIENGYAEHRQLLAVNRAKYRHRADPRLEPVAGRRPVGPPGRSQNVE